MPILPDPKLTIVLIGSDEVSWHKFTFNHIKVKKEEDIALGVINSINTNDSNASLNLILYHTFSWGSEKERWSSRICFLCHFTKHLRPLQERMECVEIFSIRSERVWVFFFFWILWEEVFAALYFFIFSSWPSRHPHFCLSWFYWSDLRSKHLSSHSGTLRGSASDFTTTRILGKTKKSHLSL